ncbi:hypothetical protein AN958_12845 [Leucoagaricus sp. SymC.cos]|nr:hypothetical protein AN958_12845 [Leucoagaricus sp. SymC.cos]
MIPSLRSCATRFHQPSIRFIGKRQWPSAVEAPQPHPAASAEFREHFADFLKRRLRQTPSGTSERAALPDSATVYSNFWEAPSKYWNPRVRELDDWEMNSIMVRVQHWYIHKKHSSYI